MVVENDAASLHCSAALVVAASQQSDVDELPAVD